MSMYKEIVDRTLKAQEIIRQEESVRSEEDFRKLVIDFERLAVEAADRGETLVELDLNPNDLRVVAGYMHSRDNTATSRLIAYLRNEGFNNVNVLVRGHPATPALRVEWGTH